MKNVLGIGTAVKNDACCFREPGFNLADHICISVLGDLTFLTSTGTSTCISAVNTCKHTPNLVKRQQKKKKKRFI